MKQFALLIILLSLWFVSLAQPYENSWINFNQQYYRIPVHETGIYRITENELISQGIDVSSFNPQNIQLFYKGEEQAIYVKEDAPGVLDYVEFYAEKNDGWFDTAMFVSPDEQTNPYYSLVNDTASYFFTWNSSFNNKRLRVTSYSNYIDYTALAYCIFDTLVQFTNRYYYGITDPEYTSGEGWFDNASLSLGSTINRYITTENVYLTGPDASIQYALIGFSNSEHHLNVLLNDVVYSDDQFYGKTGYTDTIGFDPDVLTDNFKVSFSSIDDQGAVTDYTALSYIRLQYPRAFAFSSQEQISLSIPATGDTLSYLEFSAPTAGNAIVYNLALQTRTISAFSGGTHRAIIPTGNNDNPLVMSDENDLLTASGFQKVDFTDFSALTNQKKFVIISHKKLWNQAQQYALYRDAFLVDVEELYHQFSYGITKHPLAIKNFANFIYNNWDDKPENLFLLGKAIVTHSLRKSPVNFEACLVPTFGNPPADNLFTAGLNNTHLEPLIPVGRLAASENTAVQYYLDKVKLYELAEPDEWMKQVLHFGGGISSAEQQTLAGYLRGFENIIEDTLFGGYVSTFLKNSSEPIEITISDTIKNLINNGTSMLTFFGHAAASGFDQNIDDPSAYDNYGKYPFLLANSCYSGNIHLAGSESVSERWVIIENKGVIGFLASTYLANSSDLNQYSSALYRNIAYKNYNQSIGNCIKQANIDYVGDNYDNLNVKNTSLQFTLHGDPSVKINAHELPDLTTSLNSIYTIPEDLSTEIDSFQLNIVITNIGRAFTDTFALNLIRTYADGSTEQFIEFVAGGYYKDTIAITMDINRINGAGLNQFAVNLDAGNSIVEFNEINNAQQKNIFIRTSDLATVFPYHQSIIPADTVVLIATTGDPFIESQQSIFQLDTTVAFNSSFLQEQLLTHPGGIVEWEIPANLAQNQEYFWRVSKIPESGNYNWNNSSFTYIDGVNGWSQSHPAQFQENTMSFIQLVNNEFEFIYTPKQLRCHNIGSPQGDTDFFRIEYTIDGSGDFTSCFANPKIHIVVIDSLRTTPWESNRSDFGHWNYNNTSCRIGKYFQFPVSNPDYLDHMANMIVDSVPDGNYILAYTFNVVAFSNWEDNIFNAFESLGSTEIRNVPDSFPYIFFVQKGNLSTVQEVIGEHHDDEIDLYAELANNYFLGEIASPAIGPATAWDKLEWNQHTLDNPNTDSIKLSITGITKTGSSVVLFDSLGSDAYNVDLTGINAATYPYLKLNLFTQDLINNTPAQLDFWRVRYDGVCELVIDPASQLVFYNDTVEQGENILFAAAVKNISPFTSDSVYLKYWLYNENVDIAHLDSVKTRPLSPGEWLADSLSFSSLDYAGKNQLWMEINPLLDGGYHDQLEQYHFNNIAAIDFYVQTDQSNPILDVSFDGMHIMNGDIVSAKPEIQITLTDDNPYIALDDTAMISIAVSHEETGVQPVYFSDAMGNEVLQWFPASLPDNQFKIIYNPTFEKDGLYELIINGQDVAGNYSGDFDYRIQFEVINKSTLTHVYNYPNPFSTATRFVFELTGSEIPDDFRIQILTVTGKLVREIGLDEIGDIRIGKNITAFAWDGTDMFGDRLANGLYFYRVFARLNGKEIEHRSTAGDSYFTKGYGKMYLMR